MTGAEADRLTKAALVSEFGVDRRHIGKVEGYSHGGRIKSKRDLFGIVDFYAFNDETDFWVQSTTASMAADHRRAIRRSERLAAWTRPVRSRIARRFLLFIWDDDEERGFPHALGRVEEYSYAFDDFDETIEGKVVRDQLRKEIPKR